MRAATSQEIAKAIVEAMGLPIDGCFGVEVDLDLGKPAKVLVSYHLTAEILLKAGEIATSKAANG